MKKLLLLIAVLFSIGAQAQYGARSYTYSAKDTLTDAGTVYAYLAPQGLITSTGAGIEGGYTSLGIKLTLTRLSGTAAGSATLQVSNDFVNWSTHPSASVFTLTNVAAQTAIWAIGDIDFKYYRIIVTGSGTQSLKLSDKWSVRKLN